MSLFATAKALGRALDGIAQLQDDVSDLQRARRKLDLEFTELYDKVSHQMSRMSKRYAARSKVDEEVPEDSPQLDLPIGEDAISREILKRRNGSFLR